MSDKVKAIKEQIENGTYDWVSAIETCAEKMILLTELGCGIWY